MVLNNARTSPCRYRQPTANFVKVLWTPKYSTVDYTIQHTGRVLPAPDSGSRQVMAGIVN